VASKTGDISASGARIYGVFLDSCVALATLGPKPRGEKYSAEGWAEGFADLARDVVGTHPGFVFTLKMGEALNLKMPMTTIPILAITADPVIAGLSPSLARAATSRAFAQMRDWNF
jgi:hypothetical protein